MKHKHHASIFSYSYFDAIINGQVQPVTITIFTDVNGNKYYNHILETEEKGTKNKDLSVPPARITKNSNSIPPIDKSSTPSVEQELEKVNTVDNTKIVPYKED